MSVSDIDLQLRCSYQPEQGSTKIERVLASGTGAKIVTNHDEVCLIDIRLPAGDDARARYKSIDLLLKRSQIRPLAVGLHNDDNLIQLSYTAEVADSALHVLESAGLPGTLTLRDGFSLVALVGAGVCKNLLHYHRFYQQLKDQPVEFIWQAEDGISLVAILRTRQTGHVIQGLHQSLFRAEKQIGLMVFGKGNIGSRWLELFAREQSNLCPQRV